ncbi:hypothetical protein ACDT40_18100, partial [Proteus mirabilis]
MTKKIEVFASEALPGELEDFPDIKRGWGTTKESTGGIPPMKWFNAIQKRTDEAINNIANNTLGGHSFKEGAILESGNDFIYDEDTKSWYFWIGDTPKFIDANSVASEVIDSDGGIWSESNVRGKWVPLAYNSYDKYKYRAISLDYFVNEDGNFLQKASDWCKENRYALVIPKGKTYQYSERVIFEDITLLWEGTL